MSRYVLFALVLFSFGLAAAQSLNDLTAKYGVPDVERYEVADGVTVTVLYGKDRQACQMKIEDRKNTILFDEHEAPPPGFSSDLADRLVTELVPVADRQGEAKGMMQMSGCAGVQSSDYVNVSISRGMNYCAPKTANVSSVVIRWNRLACSQK